MEIIIVLAISTTMFAVAIGFFGTRARTARDDAARLVVANIAKVRNEAQQGLGPSTDAGRGLLAGNELFGQAIEYRSTDMVVYKLMKKPNDVITAYESYEIPLTEQLQWWIIPGSADGGFCAQFNSCYNRPDDADANLFRRLFAPPIGLAGTETLMTVFRNNTGQSYALSRRGASSVLGSDLLMGEVANRLSDYTVDKQGTLRLAYAVPEGGGTLAEQMANAPVQYYVTMDLAIPNNQQLEVER